MKKIGIVGGVAWQSTVVYYSELCRRAEALGLRCEIAIESLDLQTAITYLGRDGNEQSWAGFDEYHRRALQRLEASGAELAAMASNTPHHRLESIVRGVGIPVVSIVDAAAAEAARIGARQVLILGTEITMSSPKFREAYARHGIDAAGPVDEAARSAIAGSIDDLQHGRTAGAAERLGAIAKASGRRVIALACTELPLAFAGFQTLATFEADGVQYINTTVAHIDAVFADATRSA